MISTCLNPGCNARFRYLSEGRIFTVERFVTSPDGFNRERMIEHYWLCGSCSASMKVVVENGVASAVPTHHEYMPGSSDRTGQLPVA
jgi:hypothetical protein